MRGNLATSPLEAPSPRLPATLVSAQHNINPSLRDIALDMPEARRYLGALPEEDVGLTGVLEALPVFTSKWRAKSRKMLATLVRKSGSVPPSDADPLDLAIGAMFSCHWCQAVVAVQDTLNHCCYRRKHDTHDFYCSYEDDPEWYEMTIEQHLRLLPPEIRSWSALVHQIQPLTHIGGFADFVTAEEMDASDIRFVCVACVDGNTHAKVVMTWRAAVSVPILDTVSFG